MVPEILSWFLSDVGPGNCLGMGRNQGHRLFKAAETQEGFHSRVERNAPGIGVIFNKGIQS